MIIVQMVRRCDTLTAVTCTVAALACANAAAATAPVKEVLSTHFGIGSESEATGGFAFPTGVAVAPGGNLYVADNSNHRIQVLTPTGEFVTMFGRDVNETTGGNVCSAQDVAKGAKCKSGVEGSGPGEFSLPSSVALDPSTHRLYVTDILNSRVQVFSETGEFILMFGKGVNETTGGNVCGADEIAKTGAKCKAGARRTPGSNEAGAFVFGPPVGGLIAVGGPQDLVYVADEGRVQEFDATGTQVGEIHVGSVPGEIPITIEDFVTAVAVDNVGNLYIVYREGNVIRRLDATGKLTQQFTLGARQAAAAQFSIQGLAVDPVGRVAVSEYEIYKGGFLPFGMLIDGGTGREITDFEVPAANAGGMGFDSSDGLLVAGTQGHEVFGYTAVPVGELLTRGPSCFPSTSGQAVDATVDCSLTGDVDAWGVTETQTWFEWTECGRGGRVSVTSPPAPVTNVKKEGEEEPLVQIGATIREVRPNEQLCVRLVGEDHNVRAPERLSGDLVSLTTPLAPARFVGDPSASFVTSSSVVIFGELNPENAQTRFAFQYGECRPPQAMESQVEACARSPYTLATTPEESSVYGQIATTAEVTGLQPSTTYHYRLSANSENANKTETRSSEGREGIFKTTHAPVVQAVTKSATAIKATSAVVTGTVRPGAKAAVYMFELGAYAGSDTQYGIVYSSSVQASENPVPEELGLFGLQPDTTYAYRIAISSGYGTSTGETMTFTTLGGLQSVLMPPPLLAMLPVPSISFPVKSKPPLKCKRGFKRKHGKCVKVRRHKHKAKERGKAKKK